MNILRKYALGISACLVLTGCAGTQSNPTWLLPPGSEVVLQQDIDAESRSRVYIQNGRVLERAGVSVTSPYCFFTLDRVAPQPGDSFTIRAGTFEIVKSHRQRQMVAAEGIQYAGRAGSDRTMSTVMALDADQPEVKTLTCARWGMMMDDGWPRIDEMKSTLSPLVDIVVAG